MIPPLFAIFAYPAVVFVLFRVLGWRVGLIWSILLGHMFLPPKTVYNLPLLPALTDVSTPAIAAGLMLLLFAPKALRAATGPVQPGVMPKDMIIRCVVIGFMAGAFLTVLTNLDGLFYGGRYLPPLRIYDGFSEVLTTAVLLLPMLLARKYLASDESHLLILKHYCLAGLLYSIFVLYEIIMSPQLNVQIYGYFAHDWRQHLRSGGYRPIVFMKHGLVVAIFIACAVLAGVGYVRASGKRDKVKYLAYSGWICLVLINSNSLGALAIAVVVLPLIFFLTVRIQMIIAAVLAGIVLLYPMLRGADLVPTDRVIAWAASIEEQRANSLRFRLINEDRLLAKANERPLFGWGGWGRSRVFDEEGRDISVTDGEWVIRIGQSGWLGYIGQFGLLCLPMILLFVRSRKIGVGLATSTLCLVLAGNLVDLIPNAGLTPVTWMMAGALIGRLERETDDAVASDAAGLPTGPPQAAYTRFGTSHPERQPLHSRSGQRASAPPARTT